jgi:hypothetical protein
LPENIDPQITSKLPFGVIFFIILIRLECKTDF